jgi:hypothetical protein
MWVVPDVGGVGFKCARSFGSARQYLFACPSTCTHCSLHSVTGWGTGRSRVLDVVRKAAGLNPLPLVRLVSSAFMQSIHNMAVGHSQVGSREDAGGIGEGTGESGGGEGDGVVADGDVGGAGAGGEGLTEGDMWLKTLDAVVEALPNVDGQGADSREVALACESECAGLVERLLQASPHPVECVNVLILRALGVFSQVYFRAHDALIGSVVRKILEALDGSTGSRGIGGRKLASVADVTLRRRVAMGVLHKIGSGCAAKLAVHLEELTSLIGAILPHVSAEDQGHLSSFLFLVSTRLEPPARRQVQSRGQQSVHVPHVR